MANGLTVKVEGLRDLEAALMQIEKQTSRKTVVRNSLKKAAAPIKAAMEALAPVDDGDLKSSIVVSTKRAKDAGDVAYAKVMRSSYVKGIGSDKAGAVKAMRDARRAAKGSMPPVMVYAGPSEKIFYAHLVEFGTAPHRAGGMFRGAEHPGTAPRPFIRPAWDSKRDEALRIISDEMRVQIAKAIKRQANAKAKLRK